jgi:hypothetical protein
MHSFNRERKVFKSSFPGLFRSKVLFRLCEHHKAEVISFKAMTRLFVINRAEK